MCCIFLPRLNLTKKKRKLLTMFMKLIASKVKFLKKVPYPYYRNL